LAKNFANTSTAVEETWQALPHGRVHRVISG